MLEVFDESRFAAIGPRTISDLLEQGNIVYFPKCPMRLSEEQDLQFLREQCAKNLTRKNVSYHPEADEVRGLQQGTQVSETAYRVLTTHSRNVQAFLNRAIPELFKGATIGTSSFRPVEESGRDIDAHSASELIHIDAGAYGATNGDRILRFFVNINPSRERVWVSKGDFRTLFARYAEKAGFIGPHGHVGRLEKGPLDHARTTLLKTIARAGLPLAKVLDSSPYDRAMKRFHDYMKDTPAFQSDPEGHVEVHFAPYSAWMAFADGVSHGCLSGQHCFIWTALIPVANSHFPELAPINILRAAA